MKKLLLSILLIAPFLANAQSPGGVEQSAGVKPAIWLKSDAGVAFDGSNNVTSWTNQGSIAFSFTPGTTKPTYASADKSVTFPSAASMSYSQTGTELSSVLGNGSAGQKYDVFIVGSGSNASGAYLYMGPTVPNSTATPNMDHMSFGNRAMYFNKGVGIETDGEVGFYGDANSDAQGLYTPNVGNGARGSEVIINNIASHPNAGYGDINSLVFSCNGYAAIKKVDGTATSYGSNNYAGKERSYSTGPNSSLYQPNVSYLFLGGRPSYTGSLVRAKGGKYFEIIVYNRRLSTDERQKVYSYLALKYGVYLAHDQGAYAAAPTGTGNSVGNGQTVNNATYFASDGTIIFKRDAYNFTDGTDYKATVVPYVKDTYYPLTSTNTNNNFYFLGRDDASGLDRTANGLRANAYFEKFNNATATAIDKSFVIVTNNNASVNTYSTTNDATTPYPAGLNVKGRMARTWKITSTAYNEKIKFTINAATFITNAGATAANTYLLISNDPNFTAGSTTAIQASSADASFMYFEPNLSDICGSLAAGASATKYVTVAVATDPAFNILPVTLTSFTAKANTNAVNLAWSTASEQNASHYNVTRSVDGVNFAKIGRVTAANKAHDYVYTDFSPVKGTNYYQLLEEDFDGQTQKSDVVSAKIAVSATDLTVESVTSEGVTVNIYSPKATNGKISVSNLLGQKLVNQNIALQEGYTKVTLSAQASNMVVVTLTTPEATVSKKAMR